MTAMSSRVTTGGTPVALGNDSSSRRAPVSRARRDPPTRRQTPRTPSRPNVLGVTAGLLLFALSATASLAAEPVAPKSHVADLRLLDSQLAAGDSAAAAALLRRLAPELDADERFALDATYCLLGYRRFPEARALWSGVAGRVQESLQSASGRTLSPTADEELKRRFAEVLFVQGLITAQEGQKDEALRLLRQADGYGFPPLDSPLMIVAGDCLQELQEPALAAQAYREVLKRAPQNAQARLGLGVSLFASGQLAPAASALEEVARQSPRLPRAHYYLGAVLVELKRGDEGRAHLKQELARDPRCVACLAKLAYVAYLDGDDRQCESWLAQAAALDPDFAEANLVAGMLANRTGRYDQAIRHLSRVVEQAPASARAQYQLALAYQRSGNAGKAREHQEIYNRLVQEQKARSLGVRGE
jgi:tetratricopeptide (TPR) repeat protein